MFPLKTTAALLTVALLPIVPRSSTSAPGPASADAVASSASGSWIGWMLGRAIRGATPQLGSTPLRSSPLRQLDLRGNLMGTWTTASDMPISLGEVACGIIAGSMFVFGEGSSATLMYNIANDNWFTGLAPRPFTGNHHACEVVGGRLYLFGGLGGGAGRVQIYDRPTNNWTVGASMPWNGGSCSSATIGGKVYVAGGIVGGGTVSNLSVYDPATNTWDANGPLTPMPVGVNHAAAATDGRKLYIFGGRQGGNFPQPGFDDVQVYDPVTDTWDASVMAGSQLPAMPAGRGGTGHAVHYFGLFYVMGGESSNQVFDEVQVYDPVARTWRTDTDMITARHGVFPIRHRYDILVAGGGTNAGSSSSRKVEIYRHP
ncbi:MAG: hypothetical protein GY711_32495 [bacterium]|nr:hypothetical protein [bacterium]